MSLDLSRVEVDIVLNNTGFKESNTNDKRKNKIKTARISNTLGVVC